MAEQGFRKTARSCLILIIIIHVVWKHLYGSTGFQKEGQELFNINIGSFVSVLHLHSGY